MGKRTYTQEQDAFLKRHPILDRSILTALFNREFNTEKSVEAIRNHCRRELKMHMVNVTRFKKGIEVWNKGMKGYCAAGCEKGWFKPEHDFLTKGVGYESVKENRWLRIKVTNEHKQASKNFKAKHRWVWEQHNGKIPDGMIVSFKDNNRLNCDIDNLMLIPRGEFVRLCKSYNWLNEHKELKPVIQTLAKLHEAIK
jgi:hypothetical protein